MRQFDWFGLLIGLSFGFISGFMFKGCNEQPCPETVLEHTDTIPGDSVPYPVYVGVPKPYRVEQSPDSGATVRMIDSLLNVDGAKYKATIDSLISDYLKQRFYADSFNSDTSCSISYYAVVSRNRLDSFALMSQNNRRTVINHYTSTPPDRLKIFAGAFYSTAPGISAEAITGKWSFEAGVDLQKKALIGVRYKVF